MLENLRKELIGKEISFVELDNKMMENNFYSVFDNGATIDIKDSKNVVYTNKETNEAEIQIFFNITIDNEPDEVEENFYLEVTSIEEF